MNTATKNSLFLVKLQKEGTLQRGDEVLVDGRPSLIGTIRDTDEIDVDLKCGERITLKGCGFGSDAKIVKKPMKPAF
jgi:hypothetical protein